MASDTPRHTDGGLSKADAKRGLDAFVTSAATILNGGDSVGLGGFGSFSISKRSARTGRNPQTGREQTSRAKNEVKFKAGAELSKAVN
ncbi:MULTISPECIES: HU family DNA-binding protein [Salinibaculum]|uniref:HU family DNA-binding protein n=1 Tax=Salinibaculum TaxID=2732368 RepID=UPI003612FEE1